MQIVEDDRNSFFNDSAASVGRTFKIFDQRLLFSNRKSLLRISSLK